MFSCLLPVAVETTLQVMLVVLLVEAANWGERAGGRDAGSEPRAGDAVSDSGEQQGGGMQGVSQGHQ